MKKSPENQLQEDNFENRRNYPRLNMQLPVAMSGPNGMKLKGNICNLSPSGTQIRYTANKGVDLIGPVTSAVDTTKPGPYTLKFDLGFVNAVSRVKVTAHVAYTHPLKDDEHVCGMIFSEKKLSENKKISDFLFHQLQASFAELEYARGDELVAEEEPEETTRITILEQNSIVSTNEDITGISKELKALIVQLENPNTHLEATKQLLVNILSSLKANQELSRHIDERIGQLIQKLSRMS